MIHGQALPITVYLNFIGRLPAYWLSPLRKGLLLWLRCRSKSAVINGRRQKPVQRVDPERR
nr:MAG TPA: hypothetical protein [Caudoviricetes sp.]